MKKQLLLLAALSSTCAFAQVSVTGGVRAAIQNSGAAGAQTTASTNDDAANFLQVSAVEDLGGGIKLTGNYLLRNDIMTGAVSPGTTAVLTAPTAGLWRDTFIALDAGFGQVKAGRWGTSGQYSFDSFAATGLVAPYANTGGGRFNNMVQYQTPTMAGFTGQIGATMSGATAGQEEASWLYIDYSNGPFAARVLSEKSQDTTAAQTAGTGVSASYSLPAATLMASYSRTTLVAGGATSGEGWSIGATVPMGQSTLKLGYLSQFTDTVAPYTTFAVGVNYPLSKTSGFFLDAGKTSTTANLTWQLGIEKYF